MALMVSAPASGQGKTTVTAALARRFRRQGLRVRVFKTGPDYLDPLILEQASGAPVYQLDMWMGGEDHCRALLLEAAAEADLILVEGVMGLFDGECSSADLAQRFGIPVLAVIDGSAMAQTFGALAAGLASYRPGLPFAGVLANRVAGAGHAAMLAESLPPGLRFLGWLGRDRDITLPERHLGLCLAAEVADLDARLDRAADALQDVPSGGWPVVALQPPAFRPEIPALLAGRRIGVARDAAFAFLYRANLDVLTALGAELVFFSPLSDTCLPEVDALYIPGGYPELSLELLEANTGIKAALHAIHAAGKPIVAECGGLMYLAETLVNREGRTGVMVGLLPGRTVMQSGLANLGMQSVTLPEGTLRGHTFHYSLYDGGGLTPLAWSEAARFQGRGEAVYRCGRLTASYLHLYFPSAPIAAARLFLP